MDMPPFSSTVIQMIRSQSLRALYKAIWTFCRNTSKFSDMTECRNSAVLNFSLAASINNPRFRLCKSFNSFCIRAVMAPPSRFSLKNSSMYFSRICRLIGFSSKAFIPDDAASSTIAMPELPDMPMIGSVVASARSNARNAAATSGPRMPGRKISMKTRKYSPSFDLDKTFSASSPFSTISVSAPSPATAFCKTMPVISLSSTISTLHPV